MKKEILADTGVFFKYFNGSRSAKELIENKKSEIFTLELNLAELIYLVGRKFGLETSLSRESILRNSFTVVPITKEITRKAGELKLKYSYLSLVDSYVLASSIVYKAKVATTDKPLSDASKKEGVDIILLS